MGRLSCATSVADLSIGKMSLTNSVKSLSLEDDDWNLLAHISQKMGNSSSADPVKGNHQIHPNMEMSDLMKVGWELRPKVLDQSTTRSSEHGSRGSSASSVSKRLSLGEAGVIKVRDGAEKKQQEHVIDASVFLDNLPTKPSQPKPSRGGGSNNRKVWRQRTGSPTKRAKKETSTSGMVPVQPSNFSFTTGLETTGSRGGKLLRVAQNEPAVRKGVRGAKRGVGKGVTVTESTLLSAALLNFD